MLRHEYLRSVCVFVLKYAILFFGIVCAGFFLISYDLSYRLIWPRLLVWFYLFLWSLAPTAVAGAIFAFKRNKQFQKTIKDKYLPQVLKKLAFIRTSEEGFKQAQLMESNLFSAFTDMHFDDVFCGIYKNKPFKIAEMALFNNQDSRYHQFKGIAVLFSKSNKFLHHTIILSKYDIFVRNVELGLLSSLGFVVFMGYFCYSEISQNGYSTEALKSTIIAHFMVKDIYNKNLHQISLEDLNFAKHYNVYSDNQISARVLITPVFMEKLKNIETAFGTHKLKCAFYKNNIMLAISSRRNLFEFGNLFERLDTSANCERFFAELTAVCDIIDYIPESARL